MKLKFNLDFFVYAILGIMLIDIIQSIETLFFYFSNDLDMLSIDVLTLLSVTIFDTLCVVFLFYGLISKKMILVFYWISIIFKSFYFIRLYNAEGVIAQVLIFFSIMLLHLSQEDQQKYSFTIPLIFLLIYLFSGYQKLFSMQFVNGLAPLRIFATPAWNLFNPDEVTLTYSKFKVIWIFMGNFVLGLELVGPILFFFVKKLRLPIILLFIIFHFGTIVFMGLTSFGIYMIFFNLALLFTNTSYFEKYFLDKQ